MTWSLSARAKRDKAVADIAAATYHGTEDSDDHKQFKRAKEAIAGELASYPATAGVSVSASGYVSDAAISRSLSISIGPATDVAE